MWQGVIPYTACLPECDCPEGSITIGSPGAQTFLSDLVVSGVLPPDGGILDVVLEGTLIVDEPTYSFAPGSNLCIKPGGEVVVLGNSLLKFIGTHIRGCEKRWKSITVMPLGELQIVRSSLVEDGQFAVYPRHRSVISINNSRFNRNFVALKYDDVASGGSFMLYSTQFGLGIIDDSQWTIFSEMERGEME